MKTWEKMKGGIKKGEVNCFVAGPSVKSRCHIISAMSEISEAPGGDDEEKLEGQIEDDMDELYQRVTSKKSLTADEKLFKSDGADLRESYEEMPEDVKLEIGDKLATIFEEEGNENEMLSLSEIIWKIATTIKSSVKGEGDD